MTGPYDSDDGDVLTQWALDGRGIINKPLFEVKSHINSGELVPILASTPPLGVQLAAIYPHKRFQDPKVRLMIDYMAERCQRLIGKMLA
ncbi:HTH-type transcriptional regulator DmlR [compost metagenome]